MIRLLLWSVAMLQAEADARLSQAHVRVDAALTRAWQGRSRAVDRLCGEASRRVRVQALDTKFTEVQQAYQKRFGASWKGQALVSENGMGHDQNTTKGPLSNQGGVDGRCVSTTAFAGSMGEYQNGIMIAQVELGIR